MEVKKKVGVFYLSFDTPTSVNQLYAPRAGGRGIRLSDAARIWKEYASLMVNQQWDGLPLDGHLCVTYRFFGTKMDFDNGLKILNDAMNTKVYYDDSQIIQAHVYMYRHEKDDPRVDVEIQTIG